jgi:predicted membrane channel-forming protein YqfA (hemolysin III family)
MQEKNKDGNILVLLLFGFCFLFMMCFSGWWHDFKSKVRYKRNLFLRMRAGFD